MYGDVPDIIKILTSNMNFDRVFNGIMINATDITYESSYIDI